MSAQQTIIAQENARLIALVAAFDSAAIDAYHRGARRAPKMFEIS